MTVATAVVLPTPLPFKKSPNQSARLHGIVPYLTVIHRPVGRYKPSIEWLCNPRVKASCHVITEGNSTGVDVATQLVAWDQKAWACAAFNSCSYNIEVDDDAWDGDDRGAFLTAARIAGFIHAKTGIPVVYSKSPTTAPGIIFHVDLGRAGGGHSDPTDDPVAKRAFVREVQRQVDKGGYRKTWGTGRWKRVAL